MQNKVVKHEIEVKITLALPFVIRLNEGLYRVKMNNNEFEIHLKHQTTVIGTVKTGESSFAQRASTGELTQVQDMNIPGAMTQYSIVMIHFYQRVSDFSDNNAEKIHEDVADRAHVYLNHFIDIYRSVTGDIEVRPLTGKQFYATRAGQSLHFTVNCRDIGKLTMGSLFGKRGITNLLTPFDTDRQNRVTDMLKNGVHPSIVELLLLNAKSYFDTGEFRLAIIELGAAFDINVKLVTRDILRQLGQLTNENALKLERLTTKPVVETFLKDSINEDIIHSTEWQSIDNEFRPLRNNVIHEAYQPKHEEVEKAITAIKSFSDFLMKVTIKTY